MHESFHISEISVYIHAFRSALVNWFKTSCKGQVTRSIVRVRARSTNDYSNRSPFFLVPDNLVWKWTKHSQINCLGTVGWTTGIIMHRMQLALVFAFSFVHMCSSFTGKWGLMFGISWFWCLASWLRKSKWSLVCKPEILNRCLLVHSVAEEEIKIVFDFIDKDPRNDFISIQEMKTFLVSYRFWGQLQSLTSNRTFAHIFHGWLGVCDVNAKKNEQELSLSSSADPGTGPPMGHLFKIIQFYQK